MKNIRAALKLAALGIDSKPPMGGNQPVVGPYLAALRRPVMSCRVLFRHSGQTASMPAPVTPSPKEGQLFVRQKMKKTLSIHFIAIMAAIFFSYQAHISEDKIMHYREMALERIAAKDWKAATTYLEIQRVINIDFEFSNQFSKISILVVLCSSIYALFLFRKASEE